MISALMTLAGVVVMMGFFLMTTLLAAACMCYEAVTAILRDEAIVEQCGLDEPLPDHTRR